MEEERASEIDAVLEKKRKGTANRTGKIIIGSCHLYANIAKIVIAVVVGIWITQKVHTTERTKGRKELGRYWRFEKEVRTHPQDDRQKATQVKAI